MEGDITYNGHHQDEFVVQRTAAYIEQEDLHEPQVTLPAGVFPVRPLESAQLTRGAPATAAERAGNIRVLGAVPGRGAEGRQHARAAEGGGGEGCVQSCQQLAHYCFVVIISVPMLSPSGKFIARCGLQASRRDPAVDAYMKASALSGDKHSVTAEVGARSRPDVGQAFTTI